MITSYTKVTLSNNFDYLNQATRWAIDNCPSFHKDEYVGDGYDDPQGHWTFRYLFKNSADAVYFSMRWA